MGWMSAWKAKYNGPNMYKPYVQEKMRLMRESSKSLVLVWETRMSGAPYTDTFFTEGRLRFKQFDTRITQEFELRITFIKRPLGMKLLKKSILNNWTTSFGLLDDAFKRGPSEDARNKSGTSTGVQRVTGVERNVQCLAGPKNRRLLIPVCLIFLYILRLMGHLQMA